VLSALPHVKTGRIRALGVTTAKRVTVVPEVPTIAEAGLPGFDTSQWFGILGPARMPRTIVDRLYEALTRASNLPDVKSRLVAEGVEVVNKKPDEFAEIIRRETVQWAKVIKAAGITPQ
jgi:tripartite-type tricarboxylate transporter receptor subunit TctC